MAGLFSDVGNINYGWWMGGRNPAYSTTSANAQRLDFNNDTYSTTRGLLVVNMVEQASSKIMDTPLEDYICGYHLVDRLDYSKQPPQRKIT